MPLSSPRPRHLVRRHPLWVRLTHWVNVLCLVILLFSGLQIFNAHPALYWGNASDFSRPFVSMTATRGEPQRGVTQIAGRTFDTTGVLGLSKDRDGELAERGFPHWLTLPSTQSLAMGRRWHFFFAWLFVINGLIYLVYSLISRRLRRDLAPTRKDLRTIGHSIVEHAKLRFPKGDEARRYNVLQKLAYLAVIFGLLPLVVLTGLTMSPGMDAALPLVQLFGGRQSARTLHFLAASGLILFTLVHVAMVILSGPWNNLRSMITGRYDIGSQPAEARHAS
ncbi:MAG: hypothetical protein QOD74_435 [Variibacter sp.]|nr:hypothetical protein [Variibacter sp.]